MTGNNYYFIGSLNLFNIYQYVCGTGKDSCLSQVTTGNFGTICQYCKF